MIGRNSVYNATVKLMLNDRPTIISYQIFLLIVLGIVGLIILIILVSCIQEAINKEEVDD